MQPHAELRRACNVSLIEPMGAKSPCVLGTTFGCDAGRRERVWVRDGCRGIFGCGDGWTVTGVCGKRGDSRLATCTCGRFSLCDRGPAEADLPPDRVDEPHAPMRALLRPYRPKGPPDPASMRPWGDALVLPTRSRAWNTCPGRGNANAEGGRRRQALRCAARPSKPNSAEVGEVEHAGQVRLLVGVISHPQTDHRRDAVRSTWKRGAETSGALVCFVLGRRLGAPTPRLRRSLAEEDARSRDIMWLNVSDGCGARHLSMAKPYAWWRAAAAWMAVHRSIRHAVKVDDDTSVVLPRLAADLSALRCVRHLYYGPMVVTGVHPERFQTCGFSYGGVGNWRRYGCAKHGFWPPSMFAVGALAALSSDLVSIVASSQAVRQFVERHDRVGLVPHPRVLEDMALGYWLAHAARAVNITYASLYHHASDFNCHLPNAGLKAPFSSDNVLLHGAKSQEAHAYIWPLLAHNETHNQSACTRLTRFAHVGGGGTQGAAKWQGTTH